MNMLSMSDQAIAELIGSRVEAVRLKKNVPLELVAHEAGISRQTLRNVLKGKGTLLNLIAVLRVIDELDRLVSLTEDVRPSPLQMARMAGKQRLRASSPRKKDNEPLPASGRKPLLAPTGKKDIDW
ncbi:DNA-binding protein [Pseudomonas japonica]|uniref:Transcriptional regulator, XRE family n=1 Tax=Pseudomonas japonica TaxID=256466 RepID=A0A239JNE2_9PSED|nr:DNA-binding protein [Pseudomonas japonica]SNT07330.1 transcriptional regulator, XRE family [Pseudomonas japonica]